MTDAAKTGICAACNAQHLQPDDAVVATIAIVIDSLNRGAALEFRLCAEHKEKLRRLIQQAQSVDAQGGGTVQ